MAPKKANKRAREASAAAPVTLAKEDDVSPPPKKTRFELSCDSVAQALEAAELPEACRAMLLALLPGSLGTPKAERQELQNVAAGLLEEGLQRHKASLEQAISAQEEKVKEFLGGKDALQAKAKETEAELQTLAEDVESKKQILAAASQEVLATKRAAEDSKQAQSDGDAAYSEAVKDQKAVEETLESHFRPLKEGNWETAQAKGHIDALLPLCKRIKLDASLVSAVPSSCTKKPSERGQFDVMVVQQLEDSLKAKIVSCTELLETEGPAAKARAEAAEALQQAADAAKQKQQQAATVLFDVQSVYKQKAALLEEAKASIENFEPNFKKAEEVLGVKKNDLEAFLKNNMAAFESLRDGTSEPQAEASPAGSSEAPPATKKGADLTAAAASLPELAVGGQ